MPFKEVKVYNDGSHYIGIPHSTRPNLTRKARVEEEVPIIEEEIDNSELQEENTSSYAEGVTSDAKIIEIDGMRIDTETGEVLPPIADEPPKIQRKTTRKELFEQFYKESIGDTGYPRKSFIVEKMQPYFKTEQMAKDFVSENMARKKRNMIARRIRFYRKATLQRFNYFVTFTYNDKLHTEDSFKVGLIKDLSHFSSRKDWKYIGVWERSPENNRLHFHGLFSIPDGTMPDELVEVSDYSLITKRMQTTIQNTRFNAKFGRTDFETIENTEKLDSCIFYIMKYIEKTGGKIVCSKRLPQYFISDIMETDVVCRIGLEDKKLLLFDDFSCFDEGEYMGNVSPSTIAQMRKSN